MVLVRDLPQIACQTGAENHPQDRHLVRPVLACDNHPFLHCFGSNFHQFLLNFLL
jgi:hypothetical protein